MKFTDHFLGEIGNAHEILYTLDLQLSRGYTGNPERDHDKAIASLRATLRTALDALDSQNILPHVTVLRRVAEEDRWLA